MTVFVISVKDMKIGKLVFPVSTADIVKIWQEFGS